MAREGRLYRTTGTPWSAAVYDPNQFHATDVGAIRYRFSGDSATFDYSIGERSGTLSLTRTPF